MNDTGILLYMAADGYECKLFHGAKASAANASTENNKDSDFVQIRSCGEVRLY